MIVDLLRQCVLLLVEQRTVWCLIHPGKCVLFLSILLSDWILNGFLTNKSSTFTITLSITIVCTHFLCIHIALLPCKTLLNTSQLVLWEPPWKGLFQFVFGNWRRRRVQFNFLSKTQKNTPRKTFPRIQWGEFDQSGISPRWALTTLGSFWGFSCYFHSLPLSQLIYLFFKSFPFPSVSVLCQVGSCYHRNYKCVWLWLSLCVSLFSSACLFVRLPLFSLMW